MYYLHFLGGGWAGRFIISSICCPLCSLNLNSHHLLVDCPRLHTATVCAPTWQGTWAKTSAEVWRRREGGRESYSSQNTLCMRRALLAGYHVPFCSRRPSIKVISHGSLSWNYLSTRHLSPRPTPYATSIHYYPILWSGSGINELENLWDRYS